jgi:hypothetical protein
MRGAAPTAIRTHAQGRSMPPDDHTTPPAPPTPPAASRPGTSMVHVPEDPRVDDALQQLRALLLPGETLEAHAVQRRLFALVQPRLVVAATSGRLISLQRKLFGGYDVADIRWQDLRDASLRAGTFGADLTLVALTNEDVAPVEGSGVTVTFAGLRKEQAQDVYRICQAHEQAWREKRRVRDLDELRARSGGIQLGAAGPTGAGGATADDPTTRLRRAKEMLDGRLISDAEYEAIKARIIDGL